MPKRQRYDEGVPSWVDLATPDVEAAKDFYQTLFGWEYTEEETDSNPYTMAHREGGAVAGMGPTQEGMPPVWTTYIAVEDADATAKKIEEAGGSLVMEPFDVMDSGRMAIASDPAGAIFGIWQAGAHFGAEVVNEHGALNWNELLNADLDGAVEFYKSVFGYDTETTQSGSGGDYHLFKVGDRPIAGAMEPPAEDVPNHWGVYFAVDDAEQAAETAKQKGGTVTYGPMDIPDVGKLIGATDPFGTHFTLIQPSGPVD